MINTIAHGAKESFSIKKIILSFLLIYFFLMFFISVEMVDISASRYFLLLLLLIPCFVYQVFLINGIKEYSRFVIVVVMLYIMLIMISLLRKGNLSVFLDLFTYSFFIAAYNYYDRNQKIEDFMKTINLGMVFVFVFFIFFPSLPYGQFELGGFYNLIDVPFFLTTIYPPFITGFVVTLFMFKFKEEKNPVLKSGYLTAVFFSLVYFFLINRRGPMIGVFFALFIVYFHRLFLKKYFIFFVFLAISIIPFFWQTIFETVMEYYDEDFISSFIAKADTSNILDASGRLSGWEKGYEMILNFRLSDLWGYHEEIVITDNVNTNHFHNGFFQLYYESGALALFFNLVLFIVTIHRILFLAKTKLINSFRVKSVISIFITTFVLNISESLLDRFSLTHILFILNILIIDSLYRSEKAEQKMFLKRENA